MLNHNMGRKGFTIIELITSTAIVSIIALMAINQFDIIRQKAYRASVISHLKNAYTAVQSKIADNLSDPGRLSTSYYYSSSIFYPDGDGDAYQRNYQPVSPFISNESSNPEIVMPGYRKQSDVYLFSYVLRTRANDGSLDDFIEIVAAHCGIRPTADTLTFFVYTSVNGNITQSEYYDFDDDLGCANSSD